MESSDSVSPNRVSNSLYVNKRGSVMGEYGLKSIM